VSGGMEVRTGRWVSGLPWGDMRLRAKLEPGPGLLAAPVEDVSICGRHPEWILTEEGLAGLFVPALREELRRLPTGSKRIRATGVFQAGEAGIRIVCLDSDLETVFFRFCETILTYIAEGVASPDALAGALERFRLLFERSEYPVSGQQIAGLMAELVVLEWLLEEGIEAVTGWAGPFGAAHDFTFGSIHAEVKALPASGERRIKVSSINQLEEPAGGSLYILGVRVGWGSETIEERYERVRCLVSPDRITDLERRMEAAGCPVPIEGPWNALKLCVGTPEAWRVSNGFPRLVPSLLAGGEVPKGISEVQYTASLEAARRYMVARTEVVEAIRSEEAKR